MSRLSQMSPAAIKAVLSPESDDNLITLIDIYNEDNTTVDIRISDNYLERLTSITVGSTTYTETDDNILYGVTSNTNKYLFIPMEFTMPTEEEANAPRASITFHDVTRHLTPIIRSIDYQPKVSFSLVLASTPDIVEISFTNFYISSVTYNRDSVTFDISMIAFEREPFPKDSFTPAFFPGIF